MLVADKNPLWNHAMRALADIDDLRHATVPHDRGERVRLLTTHRDDLLTGEPMDGLLNGDFHRLIQILVITHEDRFTIPSMSTPGLICPVSARSFRRTRCHQ